MPERRLENRAVAKARRNVGLTQHQISAESGIGLNRIVFFETGRCDLEAKEVDKICTVIKKHHRKNSAAMDSL